jgi:NitT/TauT family transport system ATP-binding protein
VTAVDDSLRVRDLTVSFGDYTAVEQVSLGLVRGEFVSIVGPTGSGKSTILNAVAGLLTPSAGEIAVFGEALTGINRHAGYLFQADALMPWKTALDNVAVGLEVRGAKWAEARRQAQEWLGKVGLRAFGDRYPHQLSGGMRKRCGLAQTLILDPPILLMDEPFSALDIQTRHLMENLLLELWSQDRKSVLFITHDLEEAISLSDRVLLLSAGPAAHLVGEYPIPLVRPRDVAEIRMTDAFLELHRQIWRDLRLEVQKSYAQEPAAA